MSRPDSMFTGKNRIHFTELESTNTYALNLISKINPPEGTCITADYQTGGIGQFGRSWHSQASENLLVSYILYPHFLNVRDQFLLNVVASLAVLHTVRPMLQKVAVKWPNDIYAGSQKLAGILIQNLLRGEKISATVIGIGLNINQTVFDPLLPNPTSLSLATGQTWDRDDVLSRLSWHLENHWLALRGDKHRSLMREYHDALYLIGEWAVFFISGAGETTARIVGVNREGRLQLEDQNGRMLSCNFGEVRFPV